MPLHPVIAESGFAALGAARSCPTVAEDLPGPTVVCRDLLQLFAEVSDGRCDQGRVHPVAVVLALCAAAVMAGMDSFTAIAGWAADVPAELLTQLGRKILFSAVGQFMRPVAKALTKLSNLRWCQSVKFKRLVRHTSGSQQRLDEHRLIKSRIRFPRQAQ